jgi:hypothetical protein
MANVTRFAHRIRASKSWHGAYKRVRAASGAVAALLGAAAGTALFTQTPWAHGSVQVAIWIGAAVALVVCISAMVVGPGEPAEPTSNETEPFVKELPEIVPIPGGPGSDGYMSASGEDVERARRKRNPSSSSTSPAAKTGSGPGT